MAVWVHLDCLGIKKRRVSFTPVTSANLAPSGSKLLLAAGGQTSKAADLLLKDFVMFTIATIATFMSTLKYDLLISGSLVLCVSYLRVKHSVYPRKAMATSVWRVPQHSGGFLTSSTTSFSSFAILLIQSRPHGKKSELGAMSI